jgi:hypothetical protein
MLFSTEIKRIADLRPHPRNYRLHPPDQVRRISDSLAYHGQQKPVVIDSSGMILAGHALVQGAQALGREEIACRVYDGPLPDAFVIVDNRTSDLAEDDEEVLASLLVEIREAGNLKATAFEDEELEAMLAALETPEFEQPNDDNKGGNLLPGMSYFPLIVEKEKEQVVIDWMQENLGEEPTDGLERGKRFLEWIQKGKKRK